MQATVRRLSAPAIYRPLLLAGIAAAATAALTTSPVAAWLVDEFKGEVFGTSAYLTLSTYGWLALAAAAYAIGLAVARRKRGYDRWLAGIVMGGVMLVAFAVWWRFWLPLPSGTPRALVLWAARVMAYHFYVASVPIIAWQMLEDYWERRDARKYRAGGDAP
jgi:hypothetical protein